MPSLAWCSSASLRRSRVTIRQSWAIARAAVRFHAEQEAHNALMGSLAKFREGAGASMVEDLVSACLGLAGFALQPVPLVLVPNMESVTRAVAWPMPMPGRRTCRRAWRRIGREATSLCCRKSAPLWVTSGAPSLRRA